MSRSTSFITMKVVFFCSLFVRFCLGPIISNVNLCSWQAVVTFHEMMTWKGLLVMKLKFQSWQIPTNEKTTHLCSQMTWTFICYQIIEHFGWNFYKTEFQPVIRHWILISKICQFRTGKININTGTWNLWKNVNYLNVHISSLTKMCML